MTPAQWNEYERQAQVIERHQKWKEQQKELITEIMDLDAKDGLYEISDEEPKRKALELVDKMYQSTKWGEEEDYSPLLQYQRVKKYAIISAEEVLKYSIAHGFIGLSEYYQEVIDEIKKL